MLRSLRFAKRSWPLVLLSALAACSDDATERSADDAAQPTPDSATRLSDAAIDAHNAVSSDDADVSTSADPSDAGMDASADAQVKPRPDATVLTPVDGGLYTATPIANPPTYMGTQGSDGACVQSYRTVGQAPSATDRKYPLFLYFVGTSGGATDESARFDGKAPQRVNRAMAERGFVALSVEYDNALTLASFLTNKLPCLFGSENAQSLIARACALPAVDCGLGIATWGHSQGGLLAHGAANYEARVRAVWTTGYSGMSGSKLPYDRFRTVNGEADGMNGSIAAANKTAGFTAEQCPDDGRDRCLRPDGSGWIIVRKDACKTNAADHCWFNKRSCVEGAEILEPNWSDETASTPFALEESADWVARTVARP